jgi:hypothetical protein
MRSLYHWLEDTPWLQVPVWRIVLMASAMWGAFVGLAGAGPGLA